MALFPVIPTLFPLITSIAAAGADAYVSRQGTASLGSTQLVPETELCVPETIRLALYPPFQEKIPCNAHANVHANSMPWGCASNDILSSQARGWLYHAV